MWARPGTAGRGAPPARTQCSAAASLHLYEDAMLTEHSSKPKGGGGDASHV